MKTKIVIRCMLIFLLLLLLTGCVQEPSQLTIGTIPANNPEITLKNFELTRKYLEQEMGYTVKVEVTADYLGLIEAMKNKQADIGWFGPFSYIAAADEMKLEPMVMQSRIGYGVTYHSLIVTRKDSSIERLDQLKGASFAFVDRGSTSGFVIPYSLLKSREIDYSSYFEKVEFAGTHDAVLTKVVNKQVDAGAMEDITFKNMIEDGKVKAEDIHVIWRSNPIPVGPFAARSDLHPSTKDKFKQAMITLHEKDPQAMKAFDSKIEKYAVLDDNLYNEIRNISNVLGKSFIMENFLKKK